jgi:alanine-synthesizing transaminase
MRFSRRTDWNTEESDLARALRVRREAGLPIADLTASNPTRCGFTYAPELLNALTDPRALKYDPQPKGLLQAREAVCRYYAGHGAGLDPDQIVLTTSTSEAYSFLFRLLCDTGDEVIVLQPGYPLLDFLAGLDDVQLKFAPFVYDEGWQIDFHGLRKTISPRTRAVVLVHPNNPTGHFTKVWEKEELAAICREGNLSLIVDEVFLDYGTTGTERTREQGNEKASEQGNEGAREQGSGTLESFVSGLEGVPVFAVSGLSKIAGLPQMKAAWIVATGPERQTAIDRLEVIADTFLSMSAPLQWALPMWLESATEIQGQIRERVADNLTELDRGLTEIPAVERLAFEGGWYAVLRIPALERDEQTVLNLLDRGVWVHPGYFFGMPEAGWLVISLLAPQLEFSHGLSVMINYFRKDQRSNTDGGLL